MIEISRRLAWLCAGFAVVCSAGCHAPIPSLNIFAPYGSGRVPAPATRNYLTPQNTQQYYDGQQPVPAAGGQGWQSANGGTSQIQQPATTQVAGATATAGAADAASDAQTRSVLVSAFDVKQASTAASDTVDTSQVQLATHQVEAAASDIASGLGTMVSGATPAKPAAVSVASGTNTGTNTGATGSTGTSAAWEPPPRIQSPSQNNATTVPLNGMPFSDLTRPTDFKPAAGAKPLGQAATTPSGTTPSGTTTQAPVLKWRAPQQ